MKKLQLVAGRGLGLLAGLAMVSLVACTETGNQNTDNNNTETTETTASEEAQTPADGPQVTDPQIGSIVVVANQIDVDYGKIALEKSQNEDVKGFANTMIKDHSDLIDATVKLAEELNVTPEDNPVSQSLMEGAKQTKDKLNSLSGADFDKAYIDNEVAYHEAVIHTVEQVLIPQAQNEKLKSTLQSVLPNLKHHLQMAKDIQAKFQ